MSSGVEADIALDAAVVLSLGMNRVLGRTAGLAGRGAEALAALAADKAEARAAALADAQAYDQVLREVLARNARIAALEETRGKLGANDVELPAPLEVGEDQAAEELTAWCADADRRLDEIEHGLSERLAAQVAAEIFTVPAEGLRADTGGSRPDDHAEATGAEASRAEAGKKDAGVEDDEVRRTLERVLKRLLPDTTAEDRRAVAEAVRLLAETPSVAEAEAVLTEVRLRVKAANDHTELHREAERRRAAEREAAEQAEAERRYVLDSITTAFQDMGYEVDAGFETLTADDGTLVLTRGSWPDHSVKMRLGDRQVRAAMVRERPAESEDDRRLDAEREQEWCEAFEAARERLEGAGVRSAVTWRLDPGVQELPVTAAARQTGARAGTRAGARKGERSGERERQRERERSE
ncbi:response regulator receiver protein [Actinomadura barringtoniae]|uniref:response regulator receiver protein n=1 Tax=Actinomadura barringtoniae TaxID=1427535 RepID=UPI0027DD2C1A|nr:response regulator receiver protein [Actinomadura barringtoniae]